MSAIIRITLKGIFRDRIFQGILVTALFFLAIPYVASLSMRQVTELSLTLSLSLLSFIMLLLAVFLGGTSLWKDIERRYTYSVLGLPLSRQSYLLGRFFGVALFMLLAAVILGLATVAVVALTSGTYPPERPIVWTNVAVCVLFTALKYIMLVAIAFLFSSLSTSFFLPIFGTLAALLSGGVTQQVYEYLQSPAGGELPLLARQAATGLYYLLPNFSAFDLQANAIYGLPLSASELAFSAAYCVVYTGIMLSCASVIFLRREMR